MKIWKGKKRIAFKSVNKTTLARIAEFADYKIGDIIHTCEGFNRTIIGIEYDWIHIGVRTAVLCDIVFLDSNHRTHSVSAPGCVNHKITNNEIVEYWMGFLHEKEWGFGKIAHHMKTMIDTGQSVLNINGEPIFQMPQQL